MSILVPFNGSTFIIPTPNEIGWGTNLDNYLVAIANGCLQNIGGNFVLSNDVDFGGAKGLKSLYYKSRSANLASIGIVRLANNSDSIAWRNSLNNGDHELTVNSSDLLCFDGTPVAVGGSGTVAPGIQYQLAYYASSSNQVNGLTLITPLRALQSDSNGLPVASSSTATELGYLSGVTSAIQTQLDSKSSSSLTSAHLFVGNGSNIATDTAITGDIGITNTGVTSISSGVIVNADINASAAIVYSKLALSNSILNADINTSAAIAYSKLNLSNSIVNADINSSAAIDASKIASGVVSNTEFQFLDGVTSSIQTQIDSKLNKVGITNGSNVPAGNIGEFVTNYASSVGAAASTTFGNITTISLSAGIWEIDGIGGCNATNTVSDLSLAVSLFSGNTTTDHVLADNVVPLKLPTAAAAGLGTIAGWRINITTPSIVYLKCSITTGSGGNTLVGRLSATRAG